MKHETIMLRVVKVLVKGLVQGGGSVEPRISIDCRGEWLVFTSVQGQDFSAP